MDPDIVIIQRLAIEYMDSSDFDQDSLLKVQLVLDSVVFEESTFVKMNPDMARWELQENFVVTLNTPNFSLVVRSTGREENLGSVDIHMAEIIQFLDQPLIIPLRKQGRVVANSSCFVSSCTSNLSGKVSPETLIQTVNSLDREGIILLLTQILLSGSACANADLALLNAAYMVLFQLPDDDEHKPCALGLLANIHMSRYDIYSSSNPFMYAVSFSGLRKAISMSDEAITLARVDHPKKPWLLLSHCMALQRLMSHQMDAPDAFSVSLTRLEENVIALPDDEVKKPALLHYLGISLGHRFIQKREGVDLDKAVLILQEAIKLTSDDSPNMLLFLGDLDESFSRRFDILQEPNDTYQSLLTRKRILHLTSDEDPQKFYRLDTLGLLFLLHGEQFRDVVALNESISVYEMAIASVPVDHSLKSSLLNNLSTSLSTRFELLDVLGDPEDLHRVVLLLEDALRMAVDDPKKLTFLINLGKGHLSCFYRLKDIESLGKCTLVLENAIRAAKEAASDVDQAFRLNDFVYSIVTHSLAITQPSETLSRIFLLYDDILDLIPNEHPNKPSCLDKLAVLLATQFDQENDQNHLDKSISKLEDAISLSQGPTSSTSSMSNRLGSSYLLRFEQFHKHHDDLEKSITAFERALEICNQKQATNNPLIVYNLGQAFFCRFRMGGNADDISKAIALFQDAVLLIPHDDVQRARASNDLGQALLARFESAGDVADVSEAIVAFQQSLEKGKTPDIMKNLSRSLFYRFNKLRKVHDLDLAVTTLEDAAILAFKMDSSHLYLEDLFDYFAKNFRQFTDPSDLFAAIEELKAVVTRMRPEDIYQPKGRFHNLGLFLTVRLKAIDESGDLPQSVLKDLHDAIGLIADIHPQKALWLNMLGDLYTHRFDRLKSNGDLNEAILLFEQATHITAEGSRSELKSVNHLGTSLLKRFRWLGDIEDINRCINLLESAVYRCPDNEPLERSLLNNLATCLLDRFGQFGDITDFNNAVHHFLDARSLPPIERLNDTVIDGNIGTLLIHRMELVGELDDIQGALSIYDSTTKVGTATDVNRISGIHDQSLALLHRYRRMGDAADIDKAITSLEGILHLPSLTSADKSSLLNTLGIAFSQRFVKFQNKDDLDKCIASHEGAVELLPDLHPSKPLFLFNLGRWLPVRFETARNRNDIDRAIIFLSFAAKALTGPIRWKFRAASLCAYWIRHFNRGSSLDSFNLAMDLLPQLSWIGLSVANRHVQLLEAGEVVVDAVASAIEASQYEIAVGWLEQGRSVVWAQLLELRKPVIDLTPQYPDLAERFQEVSMLLEGNLDSPTQEFNSKITLELHEKYHNLADERRQLIDKIRSQEGFSDFLRPTLFKELKDIANLAGGFIVTINLSQYRSDALALMPGSDSIVHISLPNFTLTQATRMHKTLKGLLRMKNAIRGDNRGGRPTLRNRSAVDPETAFETILAQLWENVAKPILDGIGLRVPSTRNIPRLWWCLTGALSFLPIHAAGLYSTASSFSKLSDYVVSSYTPSLLALQKSCQARKLRKPKILAIALPIESGLRCSMQEIDHVVRLAGSFPTSLLLESEASLENVTEGMKESGWVHFACHGTQNNTDWMESGLILAGGSKLSLTEITKMSLPHAEFAFLSACQTATGDELLAEEAVHLAAGMLSAGYRGVIATMWSIRDRDAPQVADVVYSYLFTNGPPDARNAAFALHLAVTKLRREGPERNSFFSWVPFIHIGA